MFSSTRGGNSHIFKANADGSNLQQLTFGNPYDYQPQWSPDGSRILYLAALFFSQIHVMGADGSNDVAITGSDMNHEGAKFSPDGTKITFHGTSANFQTNDIFVIDVGGTGLMNLTNDPDVRDALPTWSPDGTQIAFQHGLPNQIYVVNADGTNLRAVTQAGNNASALWSPDGSKVLFYRFRVSGELFSANPDGSDLQQLTMSRDSGRGFDVFGSFAPLGPPAIFEGGVILSTLAPKVKTVSPLSIISVFGENFTKQTVLFPTLNGAGDLDRILGGACLEMNDERIPIFAVTPGQINAQASEKKMLGPATFRVISNCDTANAVTSEPLRVAAVGPIPSAATSGPEMTTVEEATPGFFLYSPVGDDGLIAARFNVDNAIVAPAAMFNDEYGPSRPAQTGQIITLYGTGFGETEAGSKAGELVPGAAPLLEDANVMVTFGGIVMDPLDIFYVGATPGSAGLYQLVIRPPAQAQPGNNQVVLTVYGKSTPVGPVIPVATAQ
ncbi:MAG: hypothetical protein O2795_11825 [Acidobacteria bacterium]|nr:hypothetical protein [Acidobacteriota bacterium]